ncbi:hypothetical protein KIPB_010017 [Kipferlia bialata]|uniref:Uncharacterized protein n=1 Tax=Kipferlia bialata TaxID=797122 RepID=A0A9K3GM19_9EUKA|nr:hypothetical protein KIPB_010017 [Kipferlia bialata]|eukprot:g10017.t1
MNPHPLSLSEVNEYAAELGIHSRPAAPLTKVQLLPSVFDLGHAIDALVETVREAAAIKKKRAAPPAVEMTQEAIVLLEASVSALVSSMAHLSLTDGSIEEECRQVVRDGPPRCRDPALTVALSSCLVGLANAPNTLGKLAGRLKDIESSSTQRTVTKALETVSEACDRLTKERQSLCREEDAVSLLIQTHT